MSEQESGLESLLEGSTMRLSCLEHVEFSGSSEQLIKLAVVLSGPGYSGDRPPVENEWLWAGSAGSQGYQIDNIPFFARDFSYNDIVSVVYRADLLKGAPVFDRVLSYEGHSTYRIRLKAESEYTSDDKFSITYHFKLLSHLGCEFELGALNLVAVDVSPGIALEGVVAVLNSGFDDGIWDWEAGHVFRCDSL